MIKIPPNDRLEPIPSVEAAQQAASRIRQAIIVGRYKPGARLIERELTEQLNVSRHPVREALRVLAREGFVELHRNRGAQVSAIIQSHFTEIYSIRMALGNLALERLIGPSGALDAIDIRKFESLMQRALRFAQQQDHDAALEADLEFQQAIVDASHLDRVQRYFGELTDDVRRFSNALGMIYTDQETYVNKYIAGLFHAIRVRNLEGAGKIWGGISEKAVEGFVAALAGEELDGAKRLVSTKSMLLASARHRRACPRQASCPTRARYEEDRGHALEVRDPQLRPEGDVVGHDVGLEREEVLDVGEPPIEQLPDGDVAVPLQVASPRMRSRRWWPSQRESTISATSRSWPSRATNLVQDASALLAVDMP